jgi:phosphorylase kinase alpha/beta subunit
MALEKCRGIQIYGYILKTELTREMTREELKFALLVEDALNRIPDPEYRQVVVEACMLLTLLAQDEAKIYLNEVIVIDSIVDMANKLFIQDQIKFNGDSMLCCAVGRFCSGAKLICENFYDLGTSPNLTTLRTQSQIEFYLKRQADDTVP